MTKSAAPYLRQYSVLCTPLWRLTFHSVLVLAIFSGGYGQGAYAGACTAAPVSVCSGAADAGVDVTQTLTGSSLTVSTTAGFGIDTTITGGDALTLTGAGGLVFNDLNKSSLTGAEQAIFARNSDTGALSITTSGAVKGTAMSGGSFSLFSGISAENSGTDLTLAVTSVSGGEYGIYARNLGSGALSVTGTALVSGTSEAGISATNSADGTDLTISSATVFGGDNGIFAYNDGSGALTITTNGDTTGVGRDGIYALNEGTDVTVTAGAVSAGSVGIFAFSSGSGALSITSNGEVKAGSAGIVAASSESSTSLNLLAKADVSGGIQVLHDGTGSLTVTTEGTVSHVGHALLMDRFFADDAIDGIITNNGRLISEASAAVILQREFKFDGNFVNSGDIIGGNGVAFDASGSTHGIAFNQVAGTITGDILLGSENDVVTVTGGTISGQIIGQGFGRVNIDVGAGNAFIGNGVIDVADYVVQSGTVYQVADFSTAGTTTTVNEGATLSFNSRISGAGALDSRGTLAFVINGMNEGQLQQAGSVTLGDGSTIFVDYSGIVPALNLPIILISASSIVDNGVELEGTESLNSLLYELQLLATDTSLSIQTGVADLGTVSPLRNASAFGDSIGSFINAGGDNAVVDLLAALPAGDVQGFEQIADVFSPSVSGAVSQGSLEANDNTWRLINERFVGSEADYDKRKPLSGLWMQGYGGEADQDSNDQVDGFDADTGGVAVGYDRDLGQWRVGAAFSSAETDVDNDRYAGDSIDIESNQFMVYGGYWQDDWFASATASYAVLDYDFKRNNLISREGPIKSDTNGDLYGLSVGGGYRYEVNGIALTPQLALRYHTLRVDEYTENGGLELQVNYNDVDTLASELGVSVSTSYGCGDWQLTPVAHLAWVHEYLGDKEKARASYSDQSYIQEGFEPDSDLASLVLGLQGSNGAGLSIGIDYRGMIGSDFSRNQGSLNLRYEF